MKKHTWRSWASDALVLLGAASAVMGGFLLHPAAGCFLLSAAAVGLAVLIARGEDKERHEAG